MSRPFSEREEDRSLWTEQEREEWSAFLTAAKKYAVQIKVHKRPVYGPSKPRPADDDLFDDRLMCCFYLAEEAEDETVNIYVPDQHCVNGAGAIELAKEGVPEVKVVRVIAGEYLDTVYWFDDTKWHTIRFKKDAIRTIEEWPDYVH